MSVTMNPSSVEDVASCILEGSLDVYQAENLKESLVEYLHKTAKVTIDLTNVTAMDLTAVQLLHAARLSAQKAAKPFRIISPSPAVVQSCTALGFSVEKFLNQEAETV